MLAGGLLELALATGEVGYAITARSLIDTTMAAASVPVQGRSDLPFRAPGGGDPVLAARGLALEEDPAEGAMPSGISSCAHAAWVLWMLGAGDRYRVAAEGAMRRVSGAALDRPIAFGSALRLMGRFAAPVVQLVTVVPDDQRGAGETVGLAGTELVRVTRRHEASVAAIVTEPQARAFAAAGFELFEGRGLSQRGAAAYRCREFVCAMPVGDAASLEALGRDRESRG